MTREGEPLPMCMANRDLDCPLNCPLNSSAHDFINELAEKEELTYEEVIEKYRKLPANIKAGIQIIDEGRLLLTGNSQRCLLNR